MITLIDERALETDLITTNYFQTRKQVLMIDNFLDLKEDTKRKTNA